MGQINASALLAHEVFESYYVTLDKEASFASSYFLKNAKFYRLICQANCDFSLTHFMGEADFSSAIFKKRANFNSVIFSNSANFEGAAFDHKVSV